MHHYIQKAFDTVNHDILPDKLNYYGVKGISNLWFRKFLKKDINIQLLNYTALTQTNVYTWCATGISTGTLIICAFH